MGSSLGGHRLSSLYRIASLAHRL